MKTLFMSLFLLMSVAGFSQKGHERGPERGNYKDMSAEQIAQLETKKLTLALDLTEKQQEQIAELQMQKAVDRKARMEERESRDSKPDADERYALMNERLDKQIEMKEKMKSILNKEQFEKWEKLAAGKKMRGRCKVHRSK